MGEIWLNTKGWSYKPGVGDLWQERFKGRSFDSYLGRSSHYTQNHALKFFLRVYLNPINRQATALDSNKKTFPIKDWTTRGWGKFKEEFVKQSALWNRRFWLIPPAHFSIADVRTGGRTLRPNVMCFLFTELTDKPELAHRTIDVFNIDNELVKKLDDIDDDNPLLGGFRSNSHHLTSNDVKTGSRTYEDSESEEYTVKHHYTIAHEIGHAIGLDHIGVLKHTQKCELAIKFKKDKRDEKDMSFVYRGGSNAKVCYGIYDTAGMADNIMGLGYKFEEVNALPWQKRIAMHTNTTAAEWTPTVTALNPLGRK